MPTQPLPGEDAAPPTIDLSEDVFLDEAAALPPVAEAEPAVEPEATVEPAEGSDEPVPAE